MSMPLVPTYDTKRCYATWVKQGGTEMRSGTYKVSVPVRVTNATDDVIIPAGLYSQGSLNVTPGLPSLDIQVPCTDDPQNSPGGWEISVEVNFQDVQGEKYSFPVPVAGGDINLRTIVLTATIPPASGVLIRGVPGGIAELDADGDVVDADGVKVTGGGADLTSYATQVAGLADYPSAFPPSTHSHTTSDVTGLDTALAGKAASSHTHTTSQVTGLDTALAGKAASTHSHATSDVTGLDTALAGKASTAAATTTAAGLVELATTAEATTGTDTVRAVTPAGLKAVADTKAGTASASETAAGLVELATTTEARTGTDTARAVTPAGMAGFAMKYVALSGVTLSGRFVVAPDGATYTGGADKIAGDIVATLAP